jgi:hypothetical protein
MPRLVAASRALDIPVTGLTCWSARPPAEHVFIEANERPGLANHEPQPTAERRPALPGTGHRTLWSPAGTQGRHDPAPGARPDYLRQVLNS